MSPKFLPKIIEVSAIKRDKCFSFVSEKQNKKTPKEKKIVAITIKIFEVISTLKPICNKKEEN